MNLLFILVFATCSSLASEAQLDLRLTQWSAYQTQAKRWRHHRYELQIGQSATVSDQLKTMVEGRFRLETTMLDGGSQYHRSKEVRDDESLSSDLRNAYADYANEKLRLKLGIQQIDWAASLSPRSSDILTPIDLRYGGNGEATEIIEPQAAVLLNHKIGESSLEWLYIPLPKVHRLAKGANGYGYFEYLEKRFDAPVTDEPVEKNRRENEAGIRWLMQRNAWEWSLFAFRGHQRSPAIELTTDPSGRNRLTQKYPSVTTFSMNTTYGGDATVFRLMSFFEPKRSPNLSATNTIVSTPSGATLIPLETVYERRLMLGVGIDIVHSEHLKMYSEHYYTHSERFSKKLPDTIDKTVQTGQTTVKLTNESLEKWLFSLQTTVAGPEMGFSLSPEAIYSWDSYRVTFGGFWMESRSEESIFEPFAASDLVYLKLDHVLSISQ